MDRRWRPIISAWRAHCAQEFKNPLLNPIFVSLRESSGQRVIPSAGGSVRQLYKTLHRGGRVAILTDLTIPAQLPTVVIDCFGLKTSVTFAHAWAHRRAGATIINVHCEPLPGGRYRIVFHPPIEFPTDASFQEIAQACWDQFEPHVRANPAPWMWMYKHWRYRPLAADPADTLFMRMYRRISSAGSKSARKNCHRCLPLCPSI